MSSWVKKLWSNRGRDGVDGGVREEAIVEALELKSERECEEAGSWATVQLKVTMES